MQLSLCARPPYDSLPLSRKYITLFSSSVQVTSFIVEVQLAILSYIAYLESFLQLNFPQISGFPNHWILFSIVELFHGGFLHF